MQTFLPFALPERREPPLLAAYRPDIDGLRAVAILSVLMFHAFPAALPGGFIGVDIFFVISGYLISRIVLSGLADGDFSFMDFYVHRVRRIFPALILVLLTVLVFAWFALLAGEYQMLGKHVAGGVGFIDNLLLWQEDSYFGIASELKPVMHLWSLGIEEQFYLFFPALLLILWRTRLNLLLAVGLLAGLSFAANLKGVRVDPAGAFFLPHTRVWELLAGGLLAHHVVFNPPRGFAARFAVWGQKFAGWNHLFSALGLLLLVIGLFSIHKGSTFPGRWALLPVAGSVLLILAGPDAWVNQKILANKALVFVGLISYPLYLWHWPILSFLRILEARVPGVPIRLGAIAITFLLSWLTYRFVERPLRFGLAAERKALSLLAVAAIVGFAGWGVYRQDGMPERSVEQQYGSFQLNVGHKVFLKEIARFPACHLPDFKNAPECQQSSPLAKPMTAAVLGDSHAADLFLGLADGMGEQGNLGYFHVVCFPFYGIVGNDSCTQVAPTLDFLVAHEEIQAVILANYWTMRFRDKTIYLDGDTGNRNRSDVFEKLLGQTLRRLTAAGKNVIFAFNVPDLDFPPEACLPSRPLALTKRLSGADCPVGRDGVEARSAAYRAAAEKVLADFPQVRRWDPYSRLCDRHDCLVAKDGELLYRDDNHLSPLGARWMGRQFLAAGLLDAAATR